MRAHSKLRLDQGVRLWMRHAESLVRDIVRQAGADDPADRLCELIGIHIAAVVTGDDVVEFLHNGCCVVRAAHFVSDVVLADLAMWAVHGPPSVLAARRAGDNPPTVRELASRDTFKIFAGRRWLPIDANPDMLIAEDVA